MPVGQHSTWWASNAVAMFFVIYSNLCTFWPGYSGNMKKYIQHSTTAYLTVAVSHGLTKFLCIFITVGVGKSEPAKLERHTDSASRHCDGVGSHRNICGKWISLDECICMAMWFVRPIYLSTWPRFCLLWSTRVGHESHCFHPVCLTQLICVV